MLKKTKTQKTENKAIIQNNQSFTCKLDPSSLNGRLFIDMKSL